MKMPNNLAEALLHGLNDWYSNPLTKSMIKCMHDHVENYINNRLGPYMLDDRPGKKCDTAEQIRVALLGPKAVRKKS